MASPDPEANTDTGGSAVLSLTWFFTETYRHSVALNAVAASVGGLRCRCARTARAGRRSVRYRLCRCA